MNRVTKYMNTLKSASNEKNLFCTKIEFEGHFKGKQCIEYIAA
jgi:hypothetical protein